MPKRCSTNWTARAPSGLLEGWERFHEPVDRIVAIGPLEHVGYDC
ncbi:hypothetical protein [Mycobacterium tilburgii]